MATEGNVKKVSPYPMPVLIKTASGEIRGQLVKLTLKGFLAEVPSTPLQPGDRLDVSFELPVLHIGVNQPGVMIKLYNQWGGGAHAAPAASATATPAQTATSPTVVQLIEVHFHPLNEVGRAAIHQFLKAIKQA